MSNESLKQNDDILDAADAYIADGLAKWGPDAFRMNKRIDILPVLPPSAINEAAARAARVEVEPLLDRALDDVRRAMTIVERVLGPWAVVADKVETGAFYQGAPKETRRLLRLVENIRGVDFHLEDRYGS